MVELMWLWSRYMFALRFSYRLSFESCLSIKIFQRLKAIRKYMWIGHFLLDNLVILCPLNFILFFPLHNYHLCSSHVLWLGFFYSFGNPYVCDNPRFNRFYLFFELVVLLVPSPRPFRFAHSEGIQVTILEWIEKMSSILTPVLVLPFQCLFHALESFLLYEMLNEFTTSSISVQNNLTFD